MNAFMNDELHFFIYIFFEVHLNSPGEPAKLEGWGSLCCSTLVGRWPKGGQWSRTENQSQAQRLRWGRAPPRSAGTDLGLVPGGCSVLPPRGAR